MRGKDFYKDITVSSSAVLRARLTGKLGDRKTIERISSGFGQLCIDLLPEFLKTEIGTNAHISYIGCKSGEFRHLVSCFKEEFSFYSVSLYNVSSTLFIACSNNFIIALIECLLGAQKDMTRKPLHRPLSFIETDLAKIILIKIASVLDSGLGPSKNSEPYLEGPCTFASLQEKVNETCEFVTAINIEIILEQIRAPLILIIPQETLLKTTSILSHSNKQEFDKRRKFDNKLTEQIHKLYIDVEARIELQPITFRKISRLSVNDILPFLDKGDVHVKVNANGKKIYSGELGRTGENYTVRIRNKINSNKERFRFKEFCL